VVVIAWLIGGWAMAAEPVKATCAVAEVLFECPVKGGKVLQVCGEEGETPWMQYVFGKPGAPDLVYPAARMGSVSWFTYEERTFAQSMGQALVFTNNGVRYELVEMIGGGAGPMAESNNFAGVYVHKDDKLLATVGCTTPPKSNWERMKTLALLAESAF
jgi:hypothetical protein